MSKALVLTKSLRDRGWLGGAYDTKSVQSKISHRIYPHDFFCFYERVQSANRPNSMPVTTPRWSSLPTVSQSHLHNQCKKLLGFVEQQRAVAATRDSYVPSSTRDIQSCRSNRPKHALQPLALPQLVLSQGEHKRGHKAVASLLLKQRNDAQRSFNDAATPANQAL